MGTLRTLTGFAALAALLWAANLFILRETMFSRAVIIPLVAGAVLGIVWLLLRLATLAGTSRGSTLHGANAIIASVAFLGICFTLFAFVKRHDRQWDLTREGREELASQTIQVLESLNQDVEVYCFFIRSGDSLLDVAQDKTRRFLDKCAVYSPHLLVEFIDPQSHPDALETLDVLRVSPAGTIVLRSGTRQREIPLSLVTNRLEERTFTNALINVARESAPRIYFLTGHGGRDLKDTDPKIGGSKLKMWLEREAYLTAPLLIPVDRPAVPADCAVLVLNGYDNDLYPYEIKAFDDYVDNGGRLLILSDPQITLPTSALSVEQLRPWLRKRFGISIESDLVVSNATEGYRALLIPDFAILGDTGVFVEPTHEFRGSFSAMHPITRVLDQQMVISLARTVTLMDELPRGAGGMVLLRTTPLTWAEEDLAAIQQRRPIRQDPAERAGPLPVAVSVTLASPVRVGEQERRRDARVVVVGDSGITSNEDINYASTQNFLLNTFAWLTEKEDLIAMRATGTQDSPIVLTSRDQRYIAWVAVLGVVQVIALAGTVNLFWRRRYR